MRPVGPRRIGYNAGMAWPILGHGWAVDLLKQHLRAGGVRHAYLFTGPDQVGKRTLALAFAMALTCPEASAEAEACGRCRTCTSMRSGTHPDLSLVRLMDGESEIKIDQVRDLQRQLALTPRQAGRRIAMLVDFDLASDEAQNALLKTLEEPAERVVLLLTAATTSRLFPTLVSRCEVLNLRPVPLILIEQSLKEEGEPAERARLLAALSGGRPGAARVMKADPEALAQRQEALDDLSQLLGANRNERFAAAEAWARKRKKDEELEAVRRRVRPRLITWLTLWRDGLLASHGVQTHLANPDRAADLERLAGSFSRETLAAGVTAIQTALDRLDRYGNIQLTLETLMLDLPRLPAR
jgi:DNA polymerase III subunit delta'